MEFDKENYNIKMLRMEIDKLKSKILDGKKINKEDALIICSQSGVDLSNFAQLAKNIVKDKLNNIVSFSKNVFIPLTNACRNNCSYCGFRKDPNDDSSWILNKEQVVEIVKKGVESNCKEALFTFGERPEKKYERVKKILKGWGYSNMIEYLRDLCEDVIKIGLFPHSNAGVLEEDELKQLKEVNASLGLMLENVSSRLCEPGGPHEFSPGKVPELRLKTMELAGKLKIPFTTGILVGIGETCEERIDSLFAIKRLHEKYRHVQEIIIQNFIPQKNTRMESHLPPDVFDLIKTIIVARLIFREEMNIQVPPNLNPEYLQDLVSSGINDWGGISPITHDFINPSMAWPNISEIRQVTEKFGYILKERLPIYPKFMIDKFLPKFLKDRLRYVVDNEGFVSP